MRILGIETSCDETAAAVVDEGKKIISNVVASSIDMHAKTGGIIPEEAARQQILSILPVVEESIQNIDIKSIDALAVTVGPGLIGSLLVGVETAKTLALLWDKKIIPVNHLTAHIYANFLKEDTISPNPEFPLLAMIVSGGHTDLVYMTSHNNLEWIGGTRDDAAGEAFDKTARLLGLPYPGGPSISREAEKFRQQNPGFLYNLFPRPMIDKNNFDFSFSGLKTSVNKFIEANNDFDLTHIAAEVEEAITDVLVSKSIQAIDVYKPKCFLLGGGVAANSQLKRKFSLAFEKQGISSKFFVPSPKLCTDNAAAIATAAFYQKTFKGWKEINANPELTISAFSA